MTVTNTMPTRNDKPKPDLGFPPLMADPRDSRGRGAYVKTVPDIHPWEAERHITDSPHACEQFTLERKHAIACATDRMWSATRFVEKPKAVYHDGMLLNSVKSEDFAQDPCRHMRNVYPWTPQPPKLHHPTTGHYDGLSKPPVRQHFQPKMMPLTETEVMPSYEILTKGAMMEYQDKKNEIEFWATDSYAVRWPTWNLPWQHRSARPAPISRCGFRAAPLPCPRSSLRIWGNQLAVNGQ